MPLSEEKRKVLDSGIKIMVESGASKEDIMAYAKDFNNKFATEPEDKSPAVKKKDVSALSGAITSSGGGKYAEKVKGKIKLSEEDFKQKEFIKKYGKSYTRDMMDENSATEKESADYRYGSIDEAYKKYVGEKPKEAPFMGTPIENVTDIRGNFLPKEAIDQAKEEGFSTSELKDIASGNVESKTVKSLIMNKDGSGGSSELDVESFYVNGKKIPVNSSLSNIASLNKETYAIKQNHDKLAIQQQEIRNNPAVKRDDIINSETPEYMAEVGLDPRVWKGVSLLSDSKNESLGVDIWSTYDYMMTNPNDKDYVFQDNSETIMNSISGMYNDLSAAEKNISTLTAKRKALIKDLNFWGEQVATDVENKDRVNYKESKRIYDKLSLDLNKLDSDLLPKVYAINKKRQIADKKLTMYKSAVAKSNDKEGYSYLELLGKSFTKGAMGLNQTLTESTSNLIPIVEAVSGKKVSSEDLAEAERRGISVYDLKASEYFNVIKDMESKSMLSIDPERMENTDMNDIQKGLLFMSESLGAGMTGGGTSKAGKLLGKAKFFSMSYNAMKEEMSAPQFESLSELEKMTFSGAYGLMIGTLERMGYEGVTGNPRLLQNLTNTTLRKVFTKLPKGATIEQVEAALASDLKSKLTKGGLNLLLGSSQEALTEMGQSVAEDLMKESLNIIKETPYFKESVGTFSTEGITKSIKDSGEEGYYAFLGSLVFKAGINVTTESRNGFKNYRSDQEFKAWESLLTDDNHRDALIKSRKKAAENGEITLEDYKQEVSDIEATAGLLKSVSSINKIKQRRKAINLIIERSKIESSIEGQEENTVASQKDRIKEINEELQGISRSNTEEEIVEEENTIESTQQTSKVEKPTTEKVASPAGTRLFSEPNPETVDIANEYKKSKGIKTPEGTPFKDLDTNKSKEIANAYEAMEHNPNDPEVKEAYEAMASETVDQFEAITAKGYTFEIWTGKGEPYANSSELMDDVRNNKHMYVLSTDSDFGDTPITEKDRSENPLLKDSGIKDKNGNTLLVNDIFRGVHDFFGHTERGNSFGPKGEENAWDVHARMYSDKARRAMTTETRGQNSYVNFSGVNDSANAKFKEAARLAKEGKNKEADTLREEARSEMKFADQKIGLLPVEFSEIESKYNKVQPNQVTKENVGEKALSSKGSESNVYKAVNGVLKSMGDNAPKVFVHNTTEEYNSAISKSTNISKESIDAETSKSRGEYITGKNEIHINLEAGANALTVFHEAFHAIVKAKGFDVKDMASFVSAVKKSGNLSSDTVQRLDEFSNQYEAGEINEEFLSELIGDLASSAETMSRTQLQKLIDAINTLFKRLGLGTPFSSRAKRKEVVDFLNGVATSLSRGESIDVEISQEPDINAPSTGKEVDTSTIDRKKTLIQDLGLTRQEGIKSRITTDVNIKDIKDATIHLTFSDRLATGFVGDVEYKGGILFPAATGSVWAANSKGSAKKIINAMPVSKDGYRYIAPALMGETSHMSNTDMTNTAFKLVEDAIDNGDVSVFEAVKRIRKALKRNILSKFSKDFNISIGKSPTKKTVINAIESVIVDGSTFDERKSLLESILGKADKNKTLRFGNLPSYGTLASGLSEPMTIGHGKGDVLLVARTKGDLEIAEPNPGDSDYHPSYKYVIRSSSDVETLIFNEAYNAVDMFPSVTNSKGEIYSIKDYEAKYGDKARDRYLMYLGLGKMSTTVSREADTNASVVSRKKQLGDDGKKKKKTPISRKKIDKTTGVTKGRKKITIASEISALKNQIKLESRSARSAAKYEKEARKAIFELLKEKFKGFNGDIKGRRVRAITARALSMNLSRPETASKFIDYVNKVIDDAEKIQKIEKAKSLQKKVKRLAKISDTQVTTKEIATAYSKMDPVMATDLDEFIEIGEKLYETASKSSARIAKSKGESEVQVNIKSRHNLKDIEDYIEKEEKRAEEILKNTLLDRYPEFVDAGIINDSMTYSEMIEKIKEAEKADEVQITKEQQEELIERVKEEFEESKDTFNYILSTGVNPRTGEALTDRQKEALDTISKLEFKDVSTLKNALMLLDMMNNFSENGVTDMMATKASAFKGSIFAREMAEKVDRKPKDKGKVASAERFYNQQLSQLDNLIRNAFGGSKRLMLLFKKASGFDKLEDGASKAEIIKYKFEKAYDKLFKKTKPNGRHFYDITNKTERFVYAILFRNSGGTIEEIQKEFTKNVELEIDNLNYLMREGRHKNAGELKVEEELEAEVLLEVFERLGIPTDISKASEVNMLDIESRVDKVNKKAHSFIVDMWASRVDEISDMMQLVYNRKLDRDTNYVHISWKLKEAKNNTPIDGFNGGAMSSIDNSPSGALMETNKSGRVTDSRRLNHLFDSAQFEAFGAAMFDVHTAAAVVQFKTFIKSESAKSGRIATRRDIEAIENKVSRFYGDSKKKSPSSNSETELLSGFLKYIANAVSKYGTALGLGGPTAVFKQSTAIATTAFTAGVTNTAEGAYIFRKNPKKIKKMMEDKGIDIYLRGIQSIVDIERGKVNLKKKNIFNKYIESPAEGMAEFWLKPLIWTDSGLTKSSFMAYYIQSLKRQGLDSSNIESLDNEEALQYAKSMTNMYHNASNEKLMGDIFTSKNTSTMIIRKVLFPYASFLSNVKTRTLTDVKVLYSKQGKGERLDALRGVAASLSELAIYHGIRMTISYGAYLFVSSMLGWSPEDEDPEVLRELRKREKKLGRPMTDNEIEVEKKKIVLDILISREEKNFYSSLVSDFFSPVPAADGVLNSILNEYIVKPIQRSVYDEDYKEALSLENKERKNNMTSEEEADFKREYERNKFFTLWDRVGVDGGMLSIAPDAISNTWKFVRAARTGEVEMPDGKVRYLVGKDKDNAVTLMAFQLTHVLLLGPPDVTRNFANKGWKILEKSSLTPSQKNQWNTADAFVKKMGMDDVEESETVAIRSGGETWWSALNNSRTIPGGENKWHNSAFIISTLSKVSGLSAKEVIDRIPSEMLTADLNDQQKEKLFNLFKDDVKNNETKKVNKKIKDVTDFKEALDKNKEAAVFSKVMK